MAIDDFPAPSEGFLLTHFIVSADVERSRAFYPNVLGGEVVLEGEPTIVKLANGWIIINVGAGPTDDNRKSYSTSPPIPTWSAVCSTSTSRVLQGTQQQSGPYSPAPYLPLHPKWRPARGGATTPEC
jgi:hypothetical protein